MHSRHNVIVYYTRTIWRQDQYHNHSATHTMHCANQAHTGTSDSVSHYTPTFILSTFCTSYKVQFTLKPVWLCVKYIGAIYYVIKSLFPCIISLISNSYFLPRNQERVLLSNRDVVYIGWMFSYIIETTVPFHEPKFTALLSVHKYTAIELFIFISTLHTQTLN